ncbi:unnamed protein product [Mytilus coruscus]|uniref:Endonuclease/exonuclease/phosphatase domain-containing protein n=1 Tax=Mytilus coruscus TaxID=42192 RepID=A0A6J8C197_MYTCO|nr:unnamed protein product [Mytilus coruscus]
MAGCSVFELTLVLRQPMEDLETTNTVISLSVQLTEEVNSFNKAKRQARARFKRRKRIEQCTTAKTDPRKFGSTIKPKNKSHCSVDNDVLFNHFETILGDNPPYICNEVLDLLKLLMTKTVQNLVKTVEKVSNRVDDVEQGMNFINEKFEVAKKDVSDVKGTCAVIREDTDSANEAIFRLQKDLDELYTRHIDLQTRSMRENLIFTGIPMQDKFEESESTEKVLEKFMTEQLKLCQIAEYDRAHHFGKEYVERFPDGSVTFMTKPIVCRFRNFKEREFVRKAASELRGTHFGIREQFPKEVNDKRKELWSHFQEARIQWKKAFFKRDRLFIEGVECCPSKKDDEKRDADVPRRQYNEQVIKLDDCDVINCDEFIFSFKNRHKITSHRSGGIVLSYRKCLDKCIKPFDTDCKFVYWFSVDKKVFDLDENVVFGIVYIPPVNTNYTPAEAFDEIDVEFHRFSQNSKYIVLLGDFNSRKANLPDFYDESIVDKFIVQHFTDQFDYTDVHILDNLNIPRIDCKSLIKNNVIENNLVQQNMIGKWNIEKINEYRNTIDTDKVDYVISKLNTYNDKENDISKSDMNNLVHEVSDILIDSAKLTFGINVYYVA